MASKSINVRVEAPPGMAEAARETAESRAREAAVLSFWEAGEISTRQAAEELGLTYYDFLDLLAARGIPVEQDTFDPEALEKARQTLVEREP